MGISSPVLGLRPGRWFFLRRSKLPNPDSFTCCPDSKAARISSKNISTSSLASRLLRPSSSKSFSAISACECHFVILAVRPQARRPAFGRYRPPSAPLLYLLECLNIAEKSSPKRYFSSLNQCLRPDIRQITASRARPPAPLSRHIPSPFGLEYQRPG